MTAKQLSQVHAPKKPTTCQCGYEQHSALLAAETPYNTMADVVAYSHAALWSPVPSTVLTAIDNNWLINFPGFNPTTFKRNIPHAPATAKGHMHQQRQGIKSTKTDPEPLPILTDEEIQAIHDDYYPAHNDRTHICFAAVFQVPTGQTHSDQTGKFPIQSQKATTTSS